MSRRALPPVSEQGTSPGATGKDASKPEPKPKPEPALEIGGILGRAMESARRAEMPYLGAGQREEFPGPTMGLLFTPYSVIVVMLVVYGTAFLVASMHAGPYESIFAFALLGLAIGAASLALRWVPASWTGIVVGTDGIVVRRRFIHYSKIAEVKHKRLVLHAADAPSGAPGGAPTVLSRVSVRLVGGEVIDVALGNNVVLGDNDAMATRAIVEARMAWLGGERGSAIDEAMMARHHRSGAEWLTALRRLGGGSASAYRTRNVDLEHVARLLEDTRARPSARAAAAVVLTTLGDKTAPAKLRIAADSIADPHARVQLLRVAEAHDDAALADALDALPETSLEDRA